MCKNLFLVEKQLLLPFLIIIYVIPINYSTPMSQSNQNSSNELVEFCVVYELSLYSFNNILVDP